MIHILAEKNRLVVRPEQGDFAPQHENQLAFWGFQFESANGCFVSPPGKTEELVPKVTSYLERCGCFYEVEEATQLLLDQHAAAEAALATALEGGAEIKNGSLDVTETREFIAFLEQMVPRSLKEHQFKAALHLLSVKNGANFSVPGSGKTTVVLSVFHRLRTLGEVDALFVVGPPACFGPWRMEYKETIGQTPSYEILAGGTVDTRRTKYLVNHQSVCDLYLTTFQTLQRDWEQVRVLFEQQGIKFYFVVDEAHYISKLMVLGRIPCLALRGMQHAVQY